MDKLYPIIRRKRRPLITADMPPVVAAPLPPLAATPAVESTPLEDGHLAAPVQPKPNDAENIPHDAAE
jgi:hypothetical protein